MSKKTTAAKSTSKTLADGTRVKNIFSTVEMEVVVVKFIVLPNDGIEIIPRMDWMLKSKVS
jgi:hypothetical protein